MLRCATALLVAQQAGRLKADRELTPRTWRSFTLPLITNLKLCQGAPLELVLKAVDQRRSFCLQDGVGGRMEWDMSLT